MSNDQWEQVYERVAELVQQHRTTLVFVNTRRMAERVARHLGERLGKEAVAAHHGSLAKEAAPRRRAAAQARRAAACWSRPRRSSSASTSATSTWSASSARRARSPTFLQRVGRSGHAVGGVPKGRLFPQSRDELVECAALLDCVRRGELDALRDACRRRSTCWRSRSSPRSPAANGTRTRCSRWCAAPGRMRSCSARTSTPSCACWPKASPRAAAPRAGYLHRDAVNRKLRGRRARA